MVKQTKQRSLVTLYWASMTLLYSMVLCFLVYLWVGREIRTRETEYSQVRQTYINARENAIKAQVEQTAHYIEHQKSLAEARVRQEVRDRTQEAWETALYIWTQNRDSLPRKAIETLVHDALYAAAWDRGRGYYFAEDMKGFERVNRNNPELEGQNLMAVQDSQGKFIMKAILEVAQGPQKEGFVTYHWNRPDQPGVLVPKISYVKYFEPLDWVIGNGKYITDQEEIIKAEVLAYLDAFRYDKNEYLFAGTFDGLSLTGPFKGENKLDIVDPNGVSIVKELIRAATNGGGFVHYLAPRFQDRPPAPKISYAMAVEDWGWYIGTGVYVDEIESVILEKQAELKANIRRHLLQSGLVLILCVFCSLCLTWILSSRIRKNLGIFQRFFNQAAMRHQPLRDQDISFSELIPLAAAANRMIKERNVYEAALVENEKKYRLLFEKTKDATLIIENGRFTDCNQAALELLGVEDRSRIVGQSPADLSPPQQPDGWDSHQKAKKLLKEALEKGSLRFEWHHKKGDSTLIPVEISLTPIPDREEQVRFHAALRDITERKQAEALMVQTEKMTTVGGLAAGMAHEINNPLTGIIQSAQVIKHRLSRTLPANQAAAAKHQICLTSLAAYMEERGVLGFLDTIIGTGQRAARIVQNMLNFSRKTPGPKSAQDLTRIMDETIDLARNDYSLRTSYDIGRIVIEKDYAPALPMVVCEGNRIQQVFFNIIKNATQAVSGDDPPTPEPRLTISLFQNRHEVVITIMDNGPGIPPEIQKRIFEPFFTTKEVNQGTGLGLSVSYFIIVKDHGGRMEVSSEPGQGTCFTIALPLTGPK